MDRYSRLLPLLLCLLLSAIPVLANTAVVQCGLPFPGAFFSLNQAIAASPDHTTFLVSGTCNENVSIQGRNDLQFSGNPSATIQPVNPSAEVLTITGSKNIGFSANITINGGQGIFITGSAPVTFSFGVTVQNSGSFGVNAVDSAVHMFLSTVTGSTRSGIVALGGAVSLEGGMNVMNNGRLGISVANGRVDMSDGFGPNIVSQNGTGGIQVASTGQGNFSGAYEISSNGGPFGLVVLNNSGVLMLGGAVNSNAGLGLHCGGTSHCEILNAQFDNNGKGGIEIVEHSDASIDGGVEVSGNTGSGVLVDQSSSLTSLGGNTISNNTGDGLVLNLLSALKLSAPDTITATANNLALNCNNGSMVDGDIGAYTPKKCTAPFQANPIH